MNKKILVLTLAMFAIFSVVSLAAEAYYPYGGYFLPEVARPLYGGAVVQYINPFGSCLAAPWGPIGPWWMNTGC